MPAPANVDALAGRLQAEVGAFTIEWRKAGHVRVRWARLGNWVIADGDGIEAALTAALGMLTYLSPSAC